MVILGIINRYLYVKNVKVLVYRKIVRTFTLSLRLSGVQTLK